MADPTPEVQTEWDVFAEEIWAAPVQCWAEMIEERVRAAVAAETERCANVVELLPAQRGHAVHTPSLIAAAIRRAPDPSADEPPDA